MKVYDSIVVGAGIEGSSTAYNLVKNGQRTLLLEQFPLPHSRGSSHGQSRVTRMAYGDADYYTEMMKEAYRLWEKLENESGTTIYTKTGLLLVGKAGDELIDGTVQALRKHSVPFTTLDGKALRLKYPMLAYSDDVSGVDDHSGGVLFADKALAAFQREFIKHGGVLRDNESLVDVFPGDIVTVKTNKGSYRGRNLVLAVGPWATKVLPPLGIHLPLKVLRISVFYWKEKIAGTYGADKFPTFLGGNARGSFDVYGMPSLEYPGLYKLCLHSGPEIDPDRRDDADSTWVLDKMKKFVAEHFPLLEPHPVITETCIYTNTPDHDFVLDRHPAWRNIIIGAGFSGHGFKLSPVVGKVLAELVMRKTPSYNMSHFRIDRFNKSSKL
ncbi:peroxisomal sarcosine oxidase-like isoform X2 [Mizuhopecten yessoensis]|uniref:sarcosine oxidasee (formaldehyde-forming) n=1 Tax=Mizuhopecten yessoensis TaxID=6573 RepID=A0A210Q878_MIZYE|nr:peroxisomal sarcosine oxidase-like isoform X2 [Mizuhopecten yessoensis]OWF44915.1 Peroxisomal sarcosine oxidase [Mizuhopecten yessoensis]